METNKNPRVDVKRNSAIYFAVGLVVMLLVTNYSINYKTYDISAIDIGQLNMDDLDEEEIPITEQIKTPPQVKSPVVPDVIEVIDDEDDIEESIIESTESDEDAEILEIEDVVVNDIIEDIPIPFPFIENVPIFPGCEKGNNDAKRKCMSQKIQKLVQRKFNTDLASDLGLTGRQRINGVFKIDKSGNVVGVRSRALHPRLEKEAARVINLLPKMKPGKQRGEPVTVSYTLPIIFQVQKGLNKIVLKPLSFIDNGFLFTKPKK